MWLVSLHVPIERKLEEVPIQLHFEEICWLQDMLVLNSHRGSTWWQCLLLRKPVIPVAGPKTYILSGQPNLKDTEESEYLF